MGKNISVGAKKPTPRSQKHDAKEVFVPLPKMYNMGVQAGIKQERQRIIELIKADQRFIGARRLLLAELGDDNAE